jgi:hypothetical protein
MEEILLREHPSQVRLTTINHGSLRKQQISDYKSTKVKLTITVVAMTFGAPPRPKAKAIVVSLKTPPTEPNPPPPESKLLPAAAIRARFDQVFKETEDFERKFAALEIESQEGKFEGSK